MITITNKKDCCGCSACSQICPKKCIEMKRDEEGFLYPFIKHEDCVNCGLCEKTCPIINEAKKSETVLSAYAAYIKDEAVRLNSSSGGIFTPLAEYILRENGVVFGAALDENQYVHHARASSIDELDKLRGSKYVQSDMKQVFTDVKKNLEAGKKVLFTGTACQVSGLKCYLKKEYDNLYTVDVLCHGTPSPKLWERYLQNQQERFGSAVQQMSFRCKDHGWKMFSVKLKFADSSAYVQKFPEDDFMRLFLGNICLRPSCYDCRFKTLERDSDLTIGDAWGISRIMPEMDDDKGTSVILIHTARGQTLLNSISDFLVLKEGNADELLSPAADSRKSVKHHPDREHFFQQLDEGKTCKELADLYFPPESAFKACMRKLKAKMRRGLKKLRRK